MQCLSRIHSDSSGGHGAVGMATAVRIGVVTEQWRQQEQWLQWSQCPESSDAGSASCGIGCPELAAVLHCDLGIVTSKPGSLAFWKTLQAIQYPFLLKLAQISFCYLMILPDTQSKVCVFKKNVSIIPQDTTPVHQANNTSKLIFYSFSEY